MDRLTGMAAFRHACISWSRRAGTLVLLLVNAILSIYKPWGRTNFGRRTDAKAS
jgi:hypothetical protein